MEVYKKTHELLLNKLLTKLPKRHKEAIRPGAFPHADWTRLQKLPSHKKGSKDLASSFLKDAKLIPLMQGLQSSNSDKRDWKALVTPLIYASSTSHSPLILTLDKKFLLQHALAILRKNLEFFSPFP